MELITEINQLPDSMAMGGAHSPFSDAHYMAILCHEIGTPLASIVGLAHILANVDCSPEKKQECAQMLRASSDMLMELVKNMLDSSKMEAGRVELETIDFDVIKVVQEAAHIVTVKAAEKGLDLHVQIADGIPPLCVGDPLRIRQILVNLLSNAVKFTAKGHVALCVNCAGDDDGAEQLRITISDTGNGISGDSLEKIFDSYTQADSTISREYGGTGLGLSISRDLARLMHGDITVKSWPGIGSHFTVTLPLIKAELLLAVA